MCLRIPQGEEKRLEMKLQPEREQAKHRWHFFITLLKRKKFDKYVVCFLTKSTILYFRTH